MRSPASTICVDRRAVDSAPLRGSRPRRSCRRRSCLWSERDKVLDRVGQRAVSYVGAKSRLPIVVCSSSDRCLTRDQQLTQLVASGERRQRHDDGSRHHGAEVRRYRLRPVRHQRRDPVAAADARRRAGRPRRRAVAPRDRRTSIDGRRAVVQRVVEDQRTRSRRYRRQTSSRKPPMVSGRPLATKSAGSKWPQSRHHLRLSAIMPSLQR